MKAIVKNSIISRIAWLQQLHIERDTDASLIMSLLGKSLKLLPWHQAGRPPTLESAVCVCVCVNGQRGLSNIDTSNLATLVWVWLTHLLLHLHH